MSNKIVLVFLYAFVLNGCCNSVDYIRESKNNLSSYKKNPPCYGFLDNFSLKTIRGQIENIHKQMEDDYKKVIYYNLYDTESSRNLFQNYNLLIELFQKREKQKLVNIFDSKRVELLKKNIIKYKKEINKLIDEKVM